MNKRGAPRAKKRLTCVLLYQGKRYSGLVLDISANGLFVQTSASPDPGEPVRIEVPLPGEPEPLVMEGRAARRRVVPPKLRAVAQGGVGIALVNAPEAYFRFVAEVFHQQTKPAEEAVPKPRRKTTSLERRARKLALHRSLGSPPPPQPAQESSTGPSQESKDADRESRSGGSRRYRVRVKLGLRKQSLEVQASSEEDARRRALAEAGEGWRVLRCEPA